MHMLLVEDDSEAAGCLLKGLNDIGHSVDHAVSSETGLHMALSGDYDVLIVDRMLPGRDGLTVIRMLRADCDDTPALVLSALGEVDDRVTGLQAANISFSDNTPGLGVKMALAASTRSGQTDL